MSRTRNAAIVRITVMGVGGAGCNIVDVLTTTGSQHLTYVAANTDARALSRSAAPTKLQLGCSRVSAGAKPCYGNAAALESRRAIREVLRGCDLLVLLAGLGGGTGSGSTPVIAKIARRMGITCIAIVTLPFDFENRGRTAKEGLRRLQRHCAGTLVIDQTAILASVNADTQFEQLFSAVDNTVRSLVECVSQPLSVQIEVNLDVATLRDWLKGAGQLSHSVIRRQGGDLTQEILNALEVDDAALNQLKRARRILLVVTGPRALPSASLETIRNAVRQASRPDALFALAVTAPSQDTEGLQLTLITSRNAQHPNQRRR